jgi:hypothetical protein
VQVELTKERRQSRQRWQAQKGQAEKASEETRRKAERGLQDLLVELGCGSASCYSYDSHARLEMAAREERL